MIQEQLTTQLDGMTGAGARIFPVLAPGETPLPYIVYSVVSQVPEVALAGNVEITNTRIQVDVYAAEYGEAHQVAAQVQTALAAWNVKNVPLQAQDLYEPDTKVFRVSTDFSVWH